MKAIILSAGRGERLRPLTLERPKPLIPVANRSLIEYTLSLLKDQGINEVAMNLHYMGEQIQEQLGNGERFGIRIIYSKEPELLGTGGGIKKMMNYFGEETFIVLNADILIHIDLREAVEFHRSRNAFSTMVLRPNPDPVRYGTIETDESGRIREFLGKIRASETGLKKWMFTGIHIMDPMVTKTLPDQEAFCINRDVYAHWIRSDRPCYGYICNGYWKDLGTMEDYLQANLDILENKIPVQTSERQETLSYQVGKEVEIVAPCHIGHGAVIKDHARIGPGTVIGQDAIVGEGATVSQSVLWPNAVLEDHESLHGMIVTRNQRVQARKSNHTPLATSRKNM